MDPINSTFVEHIPPSTVKVWGYGILCTSLISLASLAGVIAFPFIYGNMYKKFITFMVGLAVGTLSSSSLLFLIPKALELKGQEMNKDNHIWKGMTVLFGIYAFFVIERVLKMITTFKEMKEINTQNHSESSDAAAAFSSFHKTTDLGRYKCVDAVSDNAGEDPDEDVKAMTRGQSESSNSTKGLIRNTSKGHSHIAPVAWMIIFGDGVHNFIDGVSIGAAFTESILAGVSVSIAIFCEELPHELGDFAVLLNGGMSMKKAILYNFLSATMCFLGLVVGILLGVNAEVHTWVFAFAGGMFLYIALVDMMPELSNTGESEDNTLSGSLCLFLLQNAGLVTGIGLMLIMAVYGEDLEKAIYHE